jgi:alkanesulfonate monooxygenase SsuD/methylene tetrahydromethanopterin reductase-like flavin-dependent oxidoreductase (luciferase family)
MRPEPDDRRRMKFGIMFELSTPRPFTRDTQRAVYENALEHARVAEEAGFNSAWAVEHHFMEEYSHSSAPDIFLGALARETTTMRLGFGIATCVPKYHSAVRLAEKAAFLDQISGGRVDFGTGRSSTWNELGGLGADPDTTKESWDEYVRAIPKMWTQERVRIDGKHVNMPERNVLPKPYQDPHPPMWTAVTSPGTEVEAGERGMGALMLSMADIDKNIPRFQAYRDAIKRCTPVGEFVNEQVAAVSWLHCHEDGALAQERGKQLFETFGYLAGQSLEVSEVFPSNAYGAYGLLSEIRPDPHAPEAAKKKPTDGFLFGDPEQLRQKVAQWERAGADQLNLMVQCAEVLPQEEVLESIRLFGREVIPKFSETSMSGEGK